MKPQTGQQGKQMLLSNSKRMYSPGSPTFSSLDRSSAIASAAAAAAAAIHSSSSSTGSHANFPQFSGASLADTCDGIIGAKSGNSQCVKFKYFSTFIVCTTCLALLSASLATHKWIVSKPIRVIRINSQVLSSPAAAAATSSSSTSLTSKTNDTKFQGEIYFGLFRGVKVLNYGFGDRYIPISGTSQTNAAGPQQATAATGTATGAQQELINFRFWLLTLISVALAILFALIGSIFAIINFVITPRGTLSGPVGLVIWNAAACFACLLAVISWLVEYFVRLQTNVLSQEEVQNGWTSENRSQFGYSYYLVVAAFVLHLVNIFIVSIVQFETWNQNKAAKRQSRALCEGVIMLY